MEKEGMPANKDQQEKKATPSPPKEASPRSHPYFGPGSASPHPPPSGPYPPRYDATATAAFAHMNHPHMYHSPHRPANGNGANRQLNGTNSSSKTDRNWNQQQQGKQQAAGSPPPMPKPPHPHAMFPPYDPKLWAERGGYAPFHYPYGPWAMMAEQNREMQPLKLPPKKKKSPDKEARATSPTEIDNIHKEDVQHMGCTCKRTKCLKLYCQCFGIKIHCGSNCRCTECHNTTEYEQERKDAMRSILSRNPSAFDSKFKADKLTEDQKLLLHKTGCKCRKSNCMKKVSLCVVRCSCLSSFLLCHVAKLFHSTVSALLGVFTVPKIVAVWDVRMWGQMGWGLPVRILKRRRETQLLGPCSPKQNLPLPNLFQKQKLKVTISPQKA